MHTHHVMRYSSSQIRDLIRAYIASNEFEAGERVASERWLADHFGISRSDVRVALASLESSHEITRKIGRAGGIFVSDNRLERNINTVESLPVIARRQGFILDSKILFSRLEPASPLVARRLKLTHGDNTVYEILRLRFLEAQPFSLEHTFLPASQFPGLLQKDLSLPLYEVLETEFATEPSTVNEQLEEVGSCEAEAGLMGVPPDSHFIRLQRLASGRREGPFEWATDLYLASRIRFTMHHSGYVRLSATRPRAKIQK